MGGGGTGLTKRNKSDTKCDPPERQLVAERYILTDYLEYTQSQSVFMTGFVSSSLNGLDEYKLFVCLPPSISNSPGIFTSINM